MTKLQTAAEMFKAYDKASIEHLFRGAAAPDAAAYGYQHGWIIVDGQSFSREDCFGPQFTYNGD